MGAGVGELSPDEDPTSVSEATTAAVLASVSDSVEKGGPKWRPEEEFEPQVARETIHSRNALFAARSDGPLFSHLESY